MCTSIPCERLVKNFSKLTHTSHKPIASVDSNFLIHIFRICVKLIASNHTNFALYFKYHSINCYCYLSHTTVKSRCPQIQNFTIYKFIDLQKSVIPSKEDKNNSIYQNANSSAWSIAQGQIHSSDCNTSLLVRNLI